jgi:toxin HigB-1
VGCIMLASGCQNGNPGSGDSARRRWPGFRLHPPKGELKGSWAVTVRANWRIIFRLEERDVLDVNCVDYH